MANGEWGGTLVEATTEFGADALRVIEWEVRSLLDFDLKNVARTAYRWDEKAFRYLRTNESVPACQLPAKSHQRNGYRAIFATLNAAIRSCVFITCTGNGNCEPSSRIGISLSNSGPECDPVKTIRTG